MAYFGLVYVGTLPVWIVSHWFKMELLPELSVWAAAVVVSMIAAAIVAATSGSREACTLSLARLGHQVVLAGIALYRFHYSWF